MAKAEDGYFDTLIAVAEDCSQEAQEPEGRGKKPTVAELHYRLIAEKPYQHTQADVLFTTWRLQQGLPAKADTAAQREEYFAKPRACLRSSPLGKKLGWGIHFDSEGRVALVDPGSATYQKLQKDPAVKVHRALRSRRAGKP